MFDTRTALLTLTIIPLLGGVTPACNDDHAASIGFHDAAEGCNASETRLERPIAVGARLDVRVDRDGGDVVVRSVSVDRTDVLAVEHVGNPFAVRALAAGTAVVTVDAGGTIAARTLHAAPIASATIAPDPLTVWNFDDNLTFLPDDPTGDLVADGIAILTDARLRLDVVFRDAEGRELLGWDVADWRASPADAVTFEPAADLSDDVIVVHGGTDGPVAITTAGGGAYDIVLASGDADRVAAWVPESHEVVDTLVVTVGQTRSVELLAWDAADRLLLGNGPGGFSATLAPTGGASPTAALVAPPWSDEVTVDEDAEALLRGLRVVWVEGLRPGQTTVVFTAAGKTLELPVTIAP